MHMRRECNIKTSSSHGAFIAPQIGDCFYSGALQTDVHPVLKTNIKLDLELFPYSFWLHTIGQGGRGVVTTFSVNKNEEKIKNMQALKDTGCLPSSYLSYFLAHFEAWKF